MSTSYDQLLDVYPICDVLSIDNDSMEQSKLPARSSV